MGKILIGLYVLFTSAALVILKLGAKTGPPIQYLHNRLQFNITPYAISGIILYGASFILYIYLISKYDLGYIIPLTTALVYIIIFTASFTIFKETYTIYKILGISLIVIGLLFLNLKK